jgi:hypothetical protein
MRWLKRNTVPRRCRRRAMTSVSPVVIHLNLGPCRPRVQAFSFRSGYFLRLHFSASPILAPTVLPF